MQKRHIQIFALLMLLVWPVNVLAQTSSADIENRNQRLNLAVQEYGAIQDPQSRQKITNSCQQAQLVLQRVERNTSSYVSQRLLTYTEIQKEVQIVKLRMMRQGADASETDLLTGKIQQVITELTEQADLQNIAIRDIILVDCVNNPEHFWAGLLKLRYEQGRLLQKAKSLKAIFDDADTKYFNQLKRRLVI